MAFDYNGTNLQYDQYSREGNAGQWMTDYFKSTFGRAPTQDEIAQFLPTYAGADKNITDTASGNAAVSRYHQQMNPNAQAEQGAPEQFETVNSLFKQYLNRDASDDEKKHFGTLLASKQYDSYSIGNFLQQLPESVQKQDADFRSSLNTQLQGQDAQYFGEQIMPGIQSDYAKSGRSFESSGFKNALAQAATQQNRQREGFLSGLTADQYQGNKDRAYQDYMNNVNYTRQRSDSISDRNQSRLYDLEDFNKQAQMYGDYLSRYGKRGSGSGIGSMAGGLIGGGIGAYFGGPAGAQAGYGMGSGVGGGVGGMFDK